MSGRVQAILIPSLVDQLVTQHLLILIMLNSEEQNSRHPVAITHP